MIAYVLLFQTGKYHGRYYSTGNKSTFQLSKAAVFIAKSHANVVRKKDGIEAEVINVEVDTVLVAKRRL